MPGLQRSGTKGPGRRLWLRSYPWGPLTVVVAVGVLDGKGAERLMRYLRKLPLENSLVLDLWDVTHLDAAGIDGLESARHRMEEASWAFAVVADPAGPCAQALRDDGATVAIPTFPDKQAARAELYQPARPPS